MQPTQTHAEVNDRPPRQRLRDLELPPDVAAEVQKLCARYGWYGKVARQQAEDEAKLQYFFGGQDVAYLVTAEGRIVVVAGSLDSDEFGKALDALSREERCQVILYSPSTWDNEISRIGLILSE